MTGYGPTAARKHNRPGRETRPRTTTIDIHSHVSVPAAAAIVEPFLDVSTIPLTLFSTPETKAVNAQQEADRRSRMSGAATACRNGFATLTRWESIFRSSCRRPCNATTRCRSRLALKLADRERRHRRICRAKTGSVHRAWHRANDGQREAVKSLKGAMRHLGLRGVQVLTNVAGRELSDPAVRSFLG